jgi:hypothetical protein
MRGNKFLILLLLFSFFFSAGFAFKVDLSPESARIFLNESAVFNLTLKNPSYNEEFFEMYSPDVLWNIRSDDILRVPSQNVFYTVLFVRPLNVNPGVYSVPLIFKEVSSGNVVEKRLIIETVSPFAPSNEYLPAVKGESDFVKEIDPRVPFDFSLILENKNRRNLPLVEVKIRSNLVNKDYSTSLKPLEKKTIKFSVDLSSLTSPQKDIFYITILVPEADRAYQFDLFPEEVRVISYGGIEEDISVEDSFLKKTIFVKVKNEGNAAQYYTYTSDVKGLSRIFFKSSDDMSLYRGDYEWDIFLEPTESSELIIVVNYRPVFWFFVFLFIVVFLYFIFRSPIVVKKSAKVIHTREGGISDVKIVLEVIHRGYKKIKNFEMIDLVPKIAEVIDENHTTIAPVYITKSENKGTLIKWCIDCMDVKDHRIITYSIRSKFSILGGIKLPVAVAKFKTEYKSREIKSNPVFIKFKF